MREIKFRGKRMDNNEWVYGYFMYTFEIGYISQSYDDVPPRKHYIFGSSDDFYEIDPGTLGQYTGLKDKNDKRIYEGDIFQTGNYPLTKEDDYVGVVEYDHDRFWGVKRVKAGSDVRGISDGMADGLWEFIDESTEVIGNIYEHPHLLNQE